MLPEASSDQVAQKCRYRIFMLVEGILLLLTILGFAALFVDHHLFLWVVIPLAVLFWWHLGAIPICIFYLIGNPIVMTLSLSSPESRAYRKELRERQTLSDDEFYARFYEGSGVPKEIPARLRRSLQKVDYLLERAIPGDFVYLVEDELDFADFLDEVEREFQIRFDEADYNDLDGTFANLVHLVLQKRGQVT